MTHGDENGLVLPPRIAPIQLVIIPIFKAANKEEVVGKARDIEKQLKGSVRVRLDDREQYTPRWKFNEYEMKGVPLRLEIGSHRAQLAFGEGAIVVTQRARPATGATPERQHAVMVRVRDLEAHHARARLHGAKIVHSPADHPYGERQYTAEDLGGHVWTFSQTIADSDPASWGGKLHSST